jgi:uncharacterized protein (TIGR00251 family)
VSRPLASGNPTARLVVRLTPRGGRDAIDGWRDGVLHVRVSAPAVEARANEALIRLLARTLGLPVGSVTIIRGEKARTKQIAIGGLSQAEAEQRLKFL